MLKARLVAWMVAMAVTVFGAGMARAQDYPNRLIRIITSEPGGGNDFGARIIAQGLAESFGQSVIVENRGGSVNLQGQLIARAPPDGYTLFVHASPAWLYPLMTDNAAYDPVKDFSPVTLAGISPLILVVHPSLPAKSVPDLIALAKARPGQLNYASSGSPGGSTHLAGELFTSMLKVNIVRVPYKGTAIALTDLIGGQVHLMFSTGPALPHVKAGRLRGLAITSAQPSALFPGLPAVAASGVPGYEAVNIIGAFAPAKTPEAVIRRLNQEMVRVLNRPEPKKKFFDAGVEVIGSSPEEFAAAVSADMNRWGKVIRDAGIRAD